MRAESDDTSHTPWVDCAWLASDAIRLEVTRFDQDAVFDTRSPSFCLLPGRLPVVLSAPHAVRQPRADASGARLPHRSEPYTGPLAIQLNRAAGAWAIYATRTAGRDPNHDAYSTYKRAGLRNVIARAAPRLVVDLHGTGCADFAVAVGTSPLARAGRASRLIDLAVDCLTARLDGAVRVDPPAFSANNPHTVTAHCWSNFGVPAIQLEISRAYRSPRHHPERYARLFGALADLVRATATAAID